MAYSTLSDKIIFVCRNIEDVNGVQAYNCFPVNKGADKVMETALYWARGYDKKVEVEQFEYDNISFDDVTITGLEVRSEGGRAYKVLVKIEDKYFYVDLRESCLMDTINMYGIEAGGKLKGSYIFIQEGSNMKLTLIGSKAHKNAVENEEKRKIKKLSNKDLVPGNVYASMNGDQLLFLGNIYSKKFNVSRESKIIEGKIEKKMIFAKVHDGTHEGYTEQIEKDLERNYLFEFKFQLSHTLREHVGVAKNLDVTDFVERLIERGKELYWEQSQQYKKGWRFSWSNNGPSNYEIEAFENYLIYNHLSPYKEIETNDLVIKNLKSLL